jgi:dolichyl-phosphate-mannose-protein mannosyltransferase
MSVVRVNEDRELAIAPQFPISGRLRTATALAIIVIAALWHLWPAVATTPFHRDEARWIGNSALLRQWRHPLGIGWQDEGYRNIYGTIDESNRRRSQPPLAMYVFGFGLIIQGEGLQTTGYWIMSHDDEWNAAHGHMPSQGELTAARRTNVVMTVLTALGMFAIGMKLSNRIGGLAMGLAYAVHPLVLDTSTRAWSDPLLVLCVVAAGVAAIRFGERPTFGRAAVIGVLLGMGAATKLSPLILAVAIGGCGLLPLTWGLYFRRRVAIRSGLALISIPVVTALMFLAAYPYLWTDPIKHTRRLFAFRSLSFDLQALVSPHARVTGLGDATRRFGVQLAKRDSVGGFLIDSLHLDSSWAWLMNVDLVLAALGWLLLVAVLVRRELDASLTMPVLVIGGQTALIAATFRLDYARYMLPLVPAVSLGIGMVAGLAWSCSARQVLALTREPRLSTALTESTP